MLNTFWHDLTTGAPVKSVVSTFCAVLATSFDGIGPLLSVLFVLWAADFALGFMRAMRLCCVSGAKMRGGVEKLLLYLVLIGVVAVTDYAVMQTCTIGHVPIRDWVACYLCLTEALSCLEHLSFFGVPVPSKIRETLLRQYRSCVSSIGAEPAKSQAKGGK